MAKKKTSAPRVRKNNRSNPQSQRPNSSPSPHSNHFPIIGVGASAGGLEAFTELLHALPKNNGMAFVFVQHLDPKHVSMLAEILSRESKMPVTEARNGVQVQPDHVYVIPRNTSVSIAKRTLRLGPRSLVSGQLTSIDTFFHALAQDQGARSIGVLLSGNGSDGTSGLKAIKSAGGIAFVQDPDTAKYDGMPRSAIGAGYVDFVRKPEEIADELVRLVDHPYIGSSGWPDHDLLPDSLDSLTNILGLVRRATGVDFRDYKPSTVKRRIFRRMVLKQAATIDSYLGILRDDPAEIQCLYDDLLINVTEFFRDPDMYDSLARHIFPRIAAKRRKGTARQIRFWVPGCSTGEEAYSLAIALAEFVGERPDGISIQIFATDISEHALKIGRAGIYPASIAQSVSPERLRRFFIKSDSGFQVHKHIRDFCIFARHNVAKDPPFSKLDLISCRNVLIYLGARLQERVIPFFHYALNPHGFLVLGSSETIGSYHGMFQLVDKKYKIYAREPGVARVPVMEPIHPLPALKENLPPKSETWTDTGLEREADRLVLSKYGPPGIVVDDNLKICQFRGHTSEFIDPAAGAASFNVLRMVNDGVAAELKAALTKARKENKSVRREGIRLTSDGNTELNLQVIPFHRRSERERKYVILFETVRNARQSPPARKEKGASPRVHSLQAELQHLRHELASSREYLQSIIEDQEASQEELQSATEEIQSSNEELQSTNEELETAKEELQSTNEELNTVNEELQNRNLQLARMGNDLVNLLANVNMPIVILGIDLRIHRFTPVTERALNLIPSDIGRPIRDINLRIRVPNLERLLKEVIDTLRPYAVDVADEDGRRYSLRVRPFRTEDNRIDGVVMVFVDLEPGKILDDLSFTTSDVRTILGPNALRDPTLTAGSALVQAQEEERRRLSHELHDELNQKLVLLELNLEMVERNVEKKSPEFAEGLKSVHNGVSELSEDLRRIAYQLHPSILDDLGLISALEAYCGEFSARENIQVRFSPGSIPNNLPSPIALALYRVVQESLRNVAKHSSAKRAWVTLARTPAGIVMTIGDSGAGFVLEDVEAGLGMIGMKERLGYVGGTIEWRSKPGKGTEVIATVPFSG